MKITMIAMTAVLVSGCSVNAARVCTPNADTQYQSCKTSVHLVLRESDVACVGSCLAQ